MPLRTDYTNTTVSTDTHPAAHNDANAQVNTNTTDVAQAKSDIANNTAAINANTAAINANATSVARALNYGEDPLTYGLPTMPRIGLTANALIGSQRIELFYIRAPVAVTVTKMRALNGGGAAAGLTLARLAIYSEAANGDLTLVGATANDTTLFAATNTLYTVNLQAATPLAAGQRYALGVLCVGTTMPNMATTTPQSWNTPLTTLAPIAAAYRSGQADLPASIAAALLTAGAVGVRYLVASP